MDRREFLDRSRQEFSKRSDAALARLGYDFARRVQFSAQAKPGSFFFQPDQVERLLQSIRHRIPGQAEKIIARAENICAHRFDLLGYADLNYGPAIDWHLDIVHGKTAPRRPFHRIKYLDFAEVGDSKVTWELNRHQHLVTLAKAYRLTGDERFAQEIGSQWRSWHAQNRYPMGINWASSLEVGFRSLSWIWVHALLDRTKFLTQEFRREYLRAQAVNGRHIERYLSTYFSPNTHLLGEGVSLFFLGTMCPDLAGAERWKSRGWRILLEAAERQVNPDGLHFEQSTYYHVYALDFFLHAALLSSANGMSLPRNFEQTIERMMDALCLLGRAGPPPRFGDDDGGRVFDGARNRDEHLLDSLATGAVVFGRDDFKALCHNLREETIWLTGEGGVAQWDGLEPKPSPLKSRSLADSGVYVLAAPDSGSQLIIKSGPTTGQIRGHAHADALSLCLNGSGHAMLIDPGTREYVGQTRERDRYRGTAAHNTLTVDGQDQAEPDGPFSWKQEIPTRAANWIVGETFTLFQGSHSGYARLTQAAYHRRCVVALRSGIFLVRDWVEGDGEHRLELSWRLAPDLQMEQENLFRFKNSSLGLAMLPAQDHVWSEEVDKGVWSPAYGSERRTTVLKFGRTCQLPAEFAMLWVPLPEAAVIPGKFQSFRPEGATDFVHAYCYETQQSDHRFFFARAGSAWSCGPIASDAEFVCVTTGKLSRTTGMILCNGSYLEAEGNRILSAARPVTRWEMVNGETPQVYCSEPEAEAESTNANLEKM
jgi:hypothetical protein